MRYDSDEVFSNAKICSYRSTGSDFFSGGLHASTTTQAQEAAGHRDVGRFPARFGFARSGDYLEDRPAIRAVGHVYPDGHATAHQEKAGIERQEPELLRCGDVLHNRRAAHG